MLHIAQTHADLLPDNPQVRARAIMWMFMPLCTPIVEYEQVPYVERDKRWFEECIPIRADRMRGRLDPPAGTYYFSRSAWPER